ncbi:MAG: hypothetical protein M0C28_46970 [Candidatus Moduliflexus flocculans]|nr:hypothetical protein [Candidatus Moduliflexus flocculans]
MTEGKVKGVAAVPKKDITEPGLGLREDRVGRGRLRADREIRQGVRLRGQEVDPLRRQGHRPFQRGALPDRREAGCHAVRLLRAPTAILMMKTLKDQKAAAQAPLGPERRLRGP